MPQMFCNCNQNIKKIGTTVAKKSVAKFAYVIWKNKIFLKFSSHRNKEFSRNVQQIAVLLDGW